MGSVVKPYLRAVKWSWLSVWARFIARRPVDQSQLPDQPPVFIVGCGRSGTTILGRVLGRHPGVAYLNEPYHRWFAVDALTDMNHLFSSGPARLFMDGDLVDPDKIRRFQRIMLVQTRRRQGDRRVIEKTPHNALRLGYLRALAPEAPIVHIVRDSLDVATSIDRVATRGVYRIAGKPLLNPWWGIADSKWRYMSSEGVRRGYYADEVNRLTTHIQRGAYEWLVSVEELDKQRPLLGAGCHELRYEQLTRDPRAVLTDLCGRLGLDAPAPWLDLAAGLLDSRGRGGGQTLCLPPRMCAAFNAHQRRLGYSNLAQPLEPQEGALERGGHEPAAMPS